jgi:hypothetical protein
VREDEKKIKNGCEIIVKSLHFATGGYSLMKITNIRTIQLTRRLSRVLRNACDARDRRRFTFVLVDTDAGITGIGDAPGNQNFIEAVIEKHYKNQAVGMDPFDNEGLWRKLYAGGAFWEIGGTALCALSAIEVACWDIRGKAEGVPVSQLLGGAKREWIDAYASDLHWDEPQFMADKAKSFVDEGFRWVKTHIGAEHDNDLVRLEAVRRAIGPDIGLMIDINTVYDRQTALVQGRRQAAFDPFWFEEPIAPTDYEGHAWLRDRLPMPIAAGENLYTVQGFTPMFACDLGNRLPEFHLGVRENFIIMDATKVCLTGGPNPGGQQASPGIVVASGNDNVANDATGVAILRHYLAQANLTNNQLNGSAPTPWNQPQILRAIAIGLGTASRQAYTYQAQGITEIDAIMAQNT